ncbi:MAG: tRNA preQ1(34) S-adenosylmethionine ribosyltransferase-isomerase QueA [Synechococcus sp. SB0668_bin_15]|nr:tRNA preQ1(34) S-adenosylmethionine ribosyltransferase-isomerase QueA [Synechococcus sp. SB0668_bin_15]MYC49631.1 tRNA preQ1(34) S-adenosylmethionine ribosyltransferase-isomerase QueA [Synechococcus sp. SB0662_bin_14]
MNQDNHLSSYDYTLPEAAIAQTPVEPRHSARLLCVEPGTGWRDTTMAHWPALLRPGDLLILNDTRVLKARLKARRASGGLVELLVLEPHRNTTWLGLVKPGQRVRPGEWLQIQPPPGQPPVAVQVLGRHGDGGARFLQFATLELEAMEQFLNIYGELPLPPYIRSGCRDEQRYQTTYACRPGAVAAPTAGLHLSEELMGRLAAAGVASAAVTLHVGLGTFQPLQTEDLSQVQLHRERVEISSATVSAVESTKAQGGRVLAVGTTSCRALEGVAALHGGQLQPYSGSVELCIRPGFRFQVMDGLLTNFHLPRSSLLLLVSALIGRQRLLRLYQEALAQGYRFYSFGDAMWIPPEAVLSPPP